MTGQITTSINMEEKQTKNTIHYHMLGIFISLHMHLRALTLLSAPGDDSGIDTECVSFARRKSFLYPFWPSPDGAGDPLSGGYDLWLDTAVIRGSADSANPRDALELLLVLFFGLRYSFDRPSNVSSWYELVEARVV